MDNGFNNKEASLKRYDRITEVRIKRFLEPWKVKIKYIKMYSGSIHYEEVYFLSVTDKGNFVLYRVSIYIYIYIRMRV